MRFGVDWGGTKIELAALDETGAVVRRERVPTPASYVAALEAVTELVRRADAALGVQGSVGVCMPGAISPATGKLRNANTLYLNGKALDHDLAALLDRPVRVENDANCFTLSEAIDGAAAGYGVVFGVILGTGCGGGLVIDHRVLRGRHGIAGEWGHTPLPWPKPADLPFKKCFCGNEGCIEGFVCGPALAVAYYGEGARDASAIPKRAEEGDQKAIKILQIHAERLARGLAQIINVYDPDAIVIGGGLSNMAHIYEMVPPMMARRVIADDPSTPLLRAKHGDSSGVRGAAWLWGRQY
jgi:fructokinase